MARRSVALILLSACTLLLSACEPQDRRPGAWLSGNEVASTVENWSFVNEQMEVFVETRPWWGVPFSVTTVIASRDGKIFVPSIYEEPAEFPGSKFWNRVVADNPNVRIKIGDKLYPMQARPAADAAEFEEGIAALAQKYDFWRKVHNGNPDNIAYTIIRMIPRDSS